MCTSVAILLRGSHSRNALFDIVSAVSFFHYVFRPLYELGAQEPVLLLQSVVVASLLTNGSAAFK